MATQSDLNVSNWALRLMGHRAILTALSDTTTEGLACNAMVDNAKQALLRMHPWNFAIKRKKISAYPEFAISNVTFVSANLLEVTHASTSFVTGQYVTITGVTGATQANGTWEIQSAVNGTTTRITVIDVPLAGDLDAYTASDTDFIRRSPAFGYTYIFDKPTGCLRVLEINEDRTLDGYKIEDTTIVGDDSNIRIKYVDDVSDYTKMDAMFYQTLAHFLAYELCDHLSASDSKKNELAAYLWGGQGKRGMLPFSRFIDSSEDATTEIQATSWVESRFSSPVTGR